MKIYLDGTLDEINHFLYGVHDEIETCEVALNDDDEEPAENSNGLNVGDLAATLRAVLKTLEANKAD